MKKYRGERGRDKSERPRCVSSVRRVEQSTKDCIWVSVSSHSAHVPDTRLPGGVQLGSS